MKRLFPLLLILLAASLARAQNNPVQATLNSVSTGACTPTSCLTIQIPSGIGSVGISVVGSSGTVVFEGLDMDGNYVALNVMPSNSTTAVSTTTVSGTKMYQVNPGGYSSVRVRLTATGSAVVTMNPSTASARIGGGGGGGTGCVTSGSSGQVLFDDGSGGCTSSSALTNGTTATTQTQADGSTKVATTAYVDTGLGTKATGTLTSCGTANAIGIFTAATTLGCGNADLTYLSHTYSLGASGTLNLSAASVTGGFEIPLAAGAAPTADAWIGFNSTTHALVWGSNSNTVVGAAAALSTNSSTTCTNQFFTVISAVAAPTCTSVLPAALDVSADNTTADATTGHHGLLLKLGGGTTNFLRADGSWASPSGSSGITNQVAKGFPYNSSGTATVLDAAIAAPTTKGVYNVIYTLPTDAAVVPTATLVGLVPRESSTGTDTILFSDNSNLVVYETAGTEAVALPTPTTLENANFFTVIANKSTDIATITPATWTISLNGAAGGSTLAMPPMTLCTVYVDQVTATNWDTNCGPLGSWQAPGAAIGSTTPVAVTATILAATSGGVVLTQHAALGHATANTITEEAPASVTAYEIVKPGTSASGMVRRDNSAAVDTESIAELSGDATTSGSNAVTLAARYKTYTCEAGLGDGLNAITAATYLQSTCYNGTGATITITAVLCNTTEGTSTLAVAGATLGVVAAAFNCSNAFASGSLTNTALTAGDWLKFTFVADGTSKQGDWVVKGTY